MARMPSNSRRSHRALTRNTISVVRTGSAESGPGVVRYARLRFMTVPPINLMGTGDVWGDKFLILADGQDQTNSRVICSLSDNGISSDNLSMTCSRNIDGPPAATPRLAIPPGVWNAIQIEFRSSRTTSSADGSLKVWINSNSYAAPTGQSGLFQLNAVNWGSVNLGFYAGTTLRAGSRLVFRLSDVQWDDEDDQNYSTGTSGGGNPTRPPASPSNLRIITSALFVIPFTLLSRRRRRTSKHGDAGDPA